MATATKKKATKSKAAKKAPAKKPVAKPSATKATQAAKPVAPSGPGSFCWRELMSTDVAGAAKFYAGLFGWAAEDAGMGAEHPYSMWMRGKEGIGGLMPQPHPGAPSAWLPYVEVANVDASASKVTSLGGALVMPPMDLPGGHGRSAVLKDPQGAYLGIYSPPRS